MTQITPEDHELFKKHMPLYECYKKHAFIRNYGKEEYNDMIHLYTTYVNAKHTFSHWCSSCRMELVNYLYGWYTNEEHLTWYRHQNQLTFETLPEEFKAEVIKEDQRVTDIAFGKRRKPKTK